MPGLQNMVILENLTRTIMYTNVCLKKTKWDSRNVNV